MPTLNIADLSLAIIWLFFAIRGYMRGLVKEVGSLAAIVMGFYCAGTYHKALAPHLTGYISGNYADTAAYLLIFTVALVAVWFLALAVSGMVKITMTQWADRFFGGGFGLAKGVILTAVLLFLIHLASPNPDFLKGSLLVPVLDKISGKLVRYIPPDINEKLRKFSKKPESAQPEAEKKPAPAAALVPDKKPAEPPHAGGEKKPEPAKKAAEPTKPDTGKKPTEPAKPDTVKKHAESAKTPAESKSSPQAKAEAQAKPSGPEKSGADKKPAKAPAKAPSDADKRPASATE
jgi:uncharacterized membrane protein required for colicin V production